MGKLKRIPSWKVAQMRLTKKYSQAEITRMTGLPRRTVRRLMTGKVKKPTPRTKRALTRAFRKAFEIDYRSYDISLPPEPQRTFDDDVDRNREKWDALYNPPPAWKAKPESAYYKVFYTVSSGRGVIGKGEVNSTSFHTMSEAAWDTLFKNLWIDVILRLSTHVSNGEGTLVITAIQIRGTWKL